MVLYQHSSLLTFGVIRKNKLYSMVLLKTIHVYFVLFSSLKKNDITANFLVFIILIKCITMKLNASHHYHLALLKVVFCPFGLSLFC